MVKCNCSVRIGAFIDSVGDQKFRGCVLADRSFACCERLVIARKILTLDTKNFRPENSIHCDQPHAQPNQQHMHVRTPLDIVRLVCELLYFIKRRQ